MIKQLRFKRSWKLIMKPGYSPITLGRQVKQFDAGAFALTEAVYSPGLALPQHVHGYATISFVLNGFCTEIVGNSPLECGPYNLILKPAGEVHSNKYGQAGAKVLLVEVKPHGLEMIQAFSRVLDHTVHAQGGLLSALAMRVHREFRTMDSVSALSIEGLLLEMVGEVTRRSLEVSSSGKPPWLRKARELINERFRERMSLSTVAAAVAVDPSHLSRMFRKHYRCTVGDYVRRLRLDYASEALTHSSSSLVEIAASAGFYDQSHFTHAFKLYRGVTPTEFRAATRKK